MNYIVLDLEWNQSPYGEVARNQNGIMPFEIIEIGAIKLNENKKIISSFDRFVRPEVYKSLHRYVGAMLPFDMETLKTGKSFKNVIEEFMEWCGEDVCFCTWGDHDLTELQRNLNFYGIDNPFSGPFIYLDLQYIFSREFLEGRRLPSLEKAVKFLGIKSTEPFHRAVNDAKYTALIMEKLGDNFIENFKSMDTYRIPKRTRDEVYFPTQAREIYVSKGFREREKAQESRTLRRQACFKCNSIMSRNVAWFCDNGKSYFAAFTCKEHGIITGRFRIKKTDDGYYYAVRTMTLSDKNGLEAVKKRKAKEEERMLAKKSCDFAGGE